MAIAIISGSFLLVLENLIRLGNLLEILLSSCYPDSYPGDTSRPSFDRPSSVRPESPAGLLLAIRNNPLSRFLAFYFAVKFFQLVGSVPGDDNCRWTNQSTIQ